MTKILKISGCSTCPYVNYDSVMPEARCLRFDIDFYNYETDENEVPQAPHPQCKLPDLPTENEIYDFARTKTTGYKTIRMIEAGANFIINKLNET